MNRRFAQGYDRLSVVHDVVEIWPMSKWLMTATHAHGLMIIVFEINVSLKMLDLEV